MGIRPEASFYFNRDEDQRELANRLDEAFDITFAKKHGELAFWLAEPKRHTRERFGLHQEVLVIYSPHQKTDARVLTAIENITRSPDFKYRIEKILYLIIHRGQEEEAEQLLSLQKDRIVVPIHADVLLNPERGSLFLRSTIANKIGEIDLFGMSSPITSDKYFFGRDELVQSLVNRSTTRHENSGLFGLRKTGKTSVLYAIRRRLEDHSVLTEYIDCQNPGVHSARWWQALENLTMACVETLKRDKKRNVKIGRAYTQSNAGTRFSSDIKSILEHGELNQVLLMLDEIEWITPEISGALGRHWDQDFVPFWQTIRATHQETQGSLTFIVAGVNPSSIEKSHFGVTPNPIFQLAIPQYLEPLSSNSVYSMARTIGRYTGIKFNHHVYPYLTEKYGGHPFLIRLACSEVWRVINTTDPEKLTPVSIENFREISEDIKKRVAPAMKDILLSLVWWYPEEYELLQILAAGDKKFLKEYLNEKGEDVTKFIRYGILKEYAEEFAITDLREFLNQYGEGYKMELSPFTRADMPPQVLPEVPDLEKLGHLFNKKCEVEINLRRAVILYLGVKHNWDPQKIANGMIKGLKARYDRKKPAELFVGRQPQEVVNTLYTLDLKEIILNNWDIFGVLFDKNKARFAMNMDTLNKARRVDSHTKPISSDEMVEFDNSYSWLLARLAKIPE